MSREPAVKIAIVGFGHIGKRIAETVLEKRAAGFDLVGVVDRHPQRVQEFARARGWRLTTGALEEIVPHADVVIECASAGVVRDLLSLAASARFHLVILSGCGLLEMDSEVMNLRAAGIRVALASGALAGLDAVSAAAYGRIEEVSLTIRRPAQGIETAPYVVSHPIDLGAIRRPTSIFVGSPREACRGFPGKVNIAAALSLESRLGERTTVEIIVVPDALEHEHRIRIRGESMHAESTMRIPAFDDEAAAWTMAWSALVSAHGLALPVTHG